MLKPSVIILCLVSIILLSSIFFVVDAACPYLAAQKVFSGLYDTFSTTSSSSGYEDEKQKYFEALKDIDFNEVRKDLKKLYTDDSQYNYWPADYGHYGGLFIRLAWHNAGSYRTSDGRGGAEGGRQRFEPEQSWDDNTNLDKARTLLWPIKQKYGLGLSWGDLFILAGNTAIEDMGGPSIDFCAGRMDDTNGAQSHLLGPNREQEILYPCEENGKCDAPLGATTVGLIYVNPEGPMGVPNPAESAPQIRDTFASRMGLNCAETVALIGGGHTFGKTHGACPAGPGPAPKDDPANPWPGMCGSTGKGNDTFTSGFEGAWTTNPIKYDNEYFTNLLEYEWEVHTGPGGHYQWRPKSSKKVNHLINSKDESLPDIMMLTSDIALLHDSMYLNFVNKYANDSSAFDDAFAEAWYKLTTRDMGPVTRCKNPQDDIPKARDWQFPLPAPMPKEKLADFTQVKDYINFIIDTHYTRSLNSLFSLLAFQCANTFRQTDFMGGCNGARIRYGEQKKWMINNDIVPLALRYLQPVKDKFSDSLTWSDLIVLAGNVGIEKSGNFGKKGMEIPFTGGRSDATNDSRTTPNFLENQFFNGTNRTPLDMKNTANIMGLSFMEYVSLLGQMPLIQMSLKPSVHYGSTTPQVFDNQMFINLFGLQWEKQEYDGRDESLVYYAKTNSAEVIELSQIIMNLKLDPEFKSIAMEFAQNNELYINQFVTAWSKLMHADIF